MNECASNESRHEQMAEAEELDAIIRRNLEALGYAE